MKVEGMGIWKRGNALRDYDNLLGSGKESGWDGKGGLVPTPLPYYPSCQTSRAAMLKTSYFARSAREPGAVSIARFPPKWFTGSRYLRLAPEPDMLKIGDREEYRRRYREEILMSLDPDEVLRDLNVDGAGHDIILLCFEKDRTHCHRGLVAEWFHETKGIRVPELGEESVTQLMI